MSADDLDPTAERVALGPADRAPSASVALDGDVWVSFGALRWQWGASHAAALFLVPAEVVGRRLRLREHELRVNPALVAHFEREFEVDLGEEAYRIESAGIQAALEDIRGMMAPLNALVDDRIGLISSEQHASMLEGSLDVTPGVLIVDGPREGVLAGLAGAEEGLPFAPARRRVLGVVPVASKSSAPVLMTTKASGKEVRAACAGLSRRAAGEFMDRGIWVLYLGIGMLHWSDPADGRAEFQDSPLLLVPVRLESSRAGAVWKLLPTEEESLVNPALWLKLENDLGIELPELDPEEPLIVEPLLRAIRSAVSDHPTWAVEERVVLSTFSFHKEAMYRDLRENFELIASHPIVSALAAGPDGEATFDFAPVDEAALDDAFPPEQAVTILDADASQRQCVAAAREGRSFVMDGPPGTGKSQTIANMIAELITHGKTVLFVSEKAAALDVVHNRLAHVGLDEYVLELHSHKTTRAAVASALGASLLRRPKPAPSLTSHDLADAARRRTALSAYARVMNEPLEELGGRSLHHLLGRIATLQQLPQAPVATGAPALDDVRELGLRLQGTWEVVERGESFVWHGATAPAWNAAVEQRVRASLETLASRLDGLRASAEAVCEELLLDPPPGPHAARDLAALLALLAARPAGHPAGVVRRRPARGGGARERTRPRLAGRLRRRGGRGGPGVARARRAAGGRDRVPPDRAGRPAGGGRRGAIRRRRGGGRARPRAIARRGPARRRRRGPRAAPGDDAAVRRATSRGLGGAGAAEVERLAHAAERLAGTADEIRVAAADLTALQGCAPRTSRSRPPRPRSSSPRSGTIILHRPRAGCTTCAPPSARSSTPYRCSRPTPRRASGQGSSSPPCSSST